MSSPLPPSRPEPTDNPRSLELGAGGITAVWKRKLQQWEFWQSNEKRQKGTLIATMSRDEAQRLAFFACYFKDEL